ncbi:MAG TPA: protein-glutamate O-methyltransferase, partial [Firmicutes bacterium]|nr:protein-glutamate O-methyltransferase [Bacillota bacterium]
AEGIPYALLKEYLKLGTGPQRGLLQVKDFLRAMIDFQQINLAAQQDYPFSEPLDLIFCRNVFIYFDKETRGRVLQHFHRCLVPGGLLCIGHSESLNPTCGQDGRWRLLRHTIYERLI